MTGAPGFDKVWAGPLDLAPLDLSGGLDAAQTLWRATLAEELYGRMPPPPEAVSVTRHSLPDAHAERLELTIKARGGQVTVDAALWLPDGANSDTPLICGLDFTGPLGVLTSDAFPMDSAARAFTRPELGAPEGRLTEVLRGTAGHRWPVDLMLARGYGVMVSCYGSWVPDDPLLWVAHGLQPLLGDPEAGAITLWAWSISRMLDAAEELGLGGGGIAVAGHSRLGKAALWAAAHDRRIGAVLANQSGCGGAALSCHGIGETLGQMAERFPHWLRPEPVLNPDDRQVDQHHLLAAIAPRRVYVASAEQDIWADPLGSYAALAKARKAWGDSADWPDPDAVWNGACIPENKALGHHIRPGGHDLLPYDWRRFLDFTSHEIATFASN